MGDMNTNPPIKRDATRISSRKMLRMTASFFWCAYNRNILPSVVSGQKAAAEKRGLFLERAPSTVFQGIVPCKRCRPMDTNGRPPEWVSAALALVDGKRGKDQGSELRRSGIDPFRIRRYFQRYYGMTFQAYCRSQRMGSALDQLQRGTRLDDVALGNGYDLTADLETPFSRIFGRPPRQEREPGLYRCLMVRESARTSRSGSKTETECAFWNLRIGECLKTSFSR